MAKVRVYELAKELGMESKDVLAKLQELGEFVRSASSTVEPPVVRKMRDLYPAVAAPSGEEKPKAKKAAPKKSAAKKQAEAAPEIPAELEAAIKEAQAARQAEREIVDQRPTFTPAPQAPRPAPASQPPRPQGERGRDNQPPRPQR
ncbi:MAG: hypothetical protein RLZZ485_1082, partial [Actinomycetota bacterium]